MKEIDVSAMTPAKVAVEAEGNMVRLAVGGVTAYAAPDTAREIILALKDAIRDAERSAQPQRALTDFETLPPFLRAVLDAVTAEPSASGQIADRAGISPSSVTPALTILTRRGLVTRTERRPYQYRRPGA